MFVITSSTLSATGNYCDITDLADMFCSVPISIASQLQFAITSAWTHTIHLTCGVLSNLAIIHSLCRRDLNYVRLSVGAQMTSH